MELLLQNSALSWLCLVALFAFCELFFMRYRMIWLSVGATVGLITSLCCGDLWLQIVLAVSVSAALLWFSRSWVKQVRCDDVLQEMNSEQKENEGDLQGFSNLQFDGLTRNFTPKSDFSTIVPSQPENTEESDTEMPRSISLFEFQTGDFT